MGYHHLGMGQFWPLGGHGFGGLMFWLLIFFICYLIYRGSRSWSRNTQHYNDALGTLNQRLARGEISADEYDAILKRIHS